MHGLQKLTLTNASVREALEDYLRKHVAPDVDVTVKSWKTSNQGYGSTDVEIEFEQQPKIVGA